MDHTNAPEWDVLAIADNGQRFTFTVFSHGKEDATAKALKHVRLMHGDVYAEDCTFTVTPVKVL